MVEIDRFKRPGEDDTAIALRLVKECGVASVPGSSFYNPASLGHWPDPLLFLQEDRDSSGCRDPSGPTGRRSNSSSHTIRIMDSPADDADRVTRLRNCIARFPKTPGVYLMKDAKGRVLYVGKAKDLRARVSSYFQDSTDLLATRGPDIARMISKVRDIDFLECETEVDALLQESRLIKDIQPPHNAQLRDDKTFPYLEITTGDDFPGVYVTRKPRLKGSKLYGPFVSAGVAARRYERVAEGVQIPHL